MSATERGGPPVEKQKYRLSLSFPGLYRELELREGAAPTVVGTTRSCNVRLARESFFRDFELALSDNGNGEWDLLCSASCYISQNGVLKLHRLTLRHGDSFVICYQNGDAELCRGEFLRDFETIGSSYYRYISLAQMGAVSIGAAPGCQMLLRDPAVGNGFVELTRSGDAWQLQDRGTRYGVSVNGNRVTGQVLLHEYDFFSVSGHSFYLRKDRLYFCNDPMMECTSLSVYEHRDSSTRMVYPHLNRSTRIYYQLPQDPLQIQNPPAKKDPPRQNLMMTILPTVAMLLIIVLLRGVMGGGGVFILFSICSMSIGLVTSIVNYRREKKFAAEGEKKRVDGYTAYIQKKDGEFEAERQKEMALLEENTPAIEPTLQTLWHFDNRLYERTPADEDFLSVRLGTGPRDAICPISIHREEYRTVDDPLAEWPEQVEAKYHTLPQAPVLLPLRRCGTVGILGSVQAQYETVKLMTLDLCVRHSYLDLKLCYLLPEKQAGDWAWVRWLRHVNNTHDPLRSIACNPDSYRSLSEMLYKELSEREARYRASHTEVLPLPHYVVFVLDAYDLMQHPISRFFGQAEKYGVTFVFCSTAAELLPKCHTLVYLDGESARIIDSADGNTVTTYLPAAVPDDQAARAAVKLASVTVDEVSLASQLTRNITLYRLLKIFSAEDLDPEPLWRTSQVYKSMAAPLGVNAKGDVICLDLHEKAHGPHGLVAGTTGSGKSEILQSYILSMATLFHPYDVGFVIIDFKGGGMVNQFRDLPHLIGSITDIDGREINRSLLSIRAELNKRKELFAAAGVNHIDQYIKKYKNHELKTPLPHLILIVDEFAELKAEQPDFMKELISTARVGRSLGVHLILATQKPAGVVDAQIWSNSRFRLCLKVATPEDSKEMLKTPLAAEIREPGRAYLQVGNNEIFELFQSAYSGAPADSEITTGQRSYHIDQIDMAGFRTCLYKVHPKATRRNEQTQLQEMVAMFHRYCEEHHIARLPGICLPPLAESYPLPAFQPAAAGAGTMVELGILDDPERQRQAPVRVDLAAQNILIVGAAQFGKSNLLQTILLQLVQQYSPRDLWVYIIDFASLAMSSLEKLPHVGGVVLPDDDEKLRNLFKLLNEESERRKKKLAEVGFSSFAAYREAGYTDLSQIVVMIDGFTTLKELYLQDDDTLQALCRDGSSLGISFVVTSAQTTGIGYKYLSCFACRLALSCNESSEYGALFGFCKIAPKRVPGRLLMEQDKQLMEVQSYLAFAGQKEGERVQQAAAFIRKQREMWSGQHARRIPEIPQLLTLSYMRQEYPDQFLQPYHVPLGLDFETVQARFLDLSAVGVLGISGREGSGRRNWVYQALATLADMGEVAPYRLYIADDVTRRYAGFAHSEATAAYSLLPSEAKAMVDTLHAEASRRYDRMMQGDMTVLSEPLLILLLQNRDAVAQIAADAACMNRYKELVGKYKGLRFCVLLTDTENTMINYSSPEPYRLLKEHRNFLVFEDLPNIKLFDVPMPLMRKFKRRLETGEAYYARENDLFKLRTPLCEGNASSVDG